MASGEGVPFFFPLPDPLLELLLFPSCSAAASLGDLLGASVASEALAAGGGGLAKGGLAATGLSADGLAVGALPPGDVVAELLPALAASDLAAGRWPTSLPLAGGLAAGLLPASLPLAAGGVAAGGVSGGGVAAELLPASLPLASSCCVVPVLFFFLQLAGGLARRRRRRRRHLSLRHGGLKYLLKAELWWCWYHGSDGGAGRCGH